MKIQAINKLTGEVAELLTDSYEEVVYAWMMASEMEKMGSALKDQLKKLVPAHIGVSGVSEPYEGHMFRLSVVQRMNYDKAVMRQVFDADTFDLLLKPDKPSVDKYLKEHLEDLGEGSTKLRESMLPEGQPYQVIKLEKLG